MAKSEALESLSQAELDKQQRTHRNSITLLVTMAVILIGYLAYQMIARGEGLSDLLLLIIPLLAVLTIAATSWDKLKALRKEQQRRQS